MKSDVDNNTDLDISNQLVLSLGGNVNVSSWNAFVSAKTSNELCAGWLALLCEQLPSVTVAAVLVESQETQTYVPMAVWPEANPSMARLAKVVETCLRDRRGVILPASQLETPDQDQVANLPSSTAQLTQIAYPILLAQQVVAVIAVEVGSDSVNENRILRLIHWSSAWLINLLSERELQDVVVARDRVSSVLEVLAITLRHGKLQQALFETVNELRQRFDCTKTAIGLVSNATVKLVGLSEAATIEKNTSLSKAYVCAMEEAYDFGKILQYGQSSEVNNKHAAHRALIQLSGSVSVVSCPLYEGGRIVGILILERAAKSFEQAEIAWLDTFTSMIAPIVSQRKKAERNSFLRLLDEGKLILGKLFGPDNLLWKCSATLILTITLVLLFVQIDYRVTAKTVIEGEVQRAVSAPFDGFIAASHVRAGDTVKQGRLLASLDDRDLMIEKARWSSEYDQYENRLLEAMATHDLVAVQVISAQLSQAEAELKLVNKKLTYSKLVAPFDGLVVSGDLSQQIGAPIEVGKKLFEIAPLHSYRVILQVDEREVRHVQVGQLGKLVITGIAGDPMPLKIQKITPVATAQDGKNFFRVEASLLEASARLRPGMEGVGKVVTQSQSLGWVLLHSFNDWLRLTLWTWIP